MTDTKAAVRGGAGHHVAVNTITDRPKRVLLVVANPATATNTGWPAGCWAAELTHPYYELTERGIEVTIASPNGGKVEFDALSDPRDESQWSAEDLISMGFANTPALMALIDATLSDGSYLVAGKSVTGFANIDEDHSNKAAGVEVMPWRAEDALRERGANYVQAGLFKAFAVRDGRLVTGQQQYSAREVTRLVIDMLGV
ncbi:MAG TPA: type 1 glutamine amidotransferase domain-containing protein [Pseudonocardiaceae bacterium]